PQAAEDAADTDRVTDRLAQPELGRDVEVEPGRVVPADLDLVDHVLGTLDRRSAVERGGDRDAGTGLVDDPVDQPLGEGESLGADVVQRQVELPAQLGESAQVSCDIPGELDAP